MFSSGQIVLMRLAAVAMCCALILALSSDLGLMRARAHKARARAEEAARAAVAQVDRRQPLEAQRRQIDDNLRAALAAEGEDPAYWRSSLLISGTHLPPTLSVVVSTDQPVETAVLSWISPESARVKAEAVAEAPAAEPRVIARAGEEQATL